MELRHKFLSPLQPRKKKEDPLFNCYLGAALSVVNNPNSVDEFLTDFAKPGLMTDKSVERL